MSPTRAVPLPTPNPMSRTRPMRRTHPTRPAPAGPVEPRPGGQALAAGRMAAAPWPGRVGTPWATALLAGATLWLAGCAQPSPVRPAPPLTPPAALGLSADTRSPELAPDWWRAWGDARLDRLVAQALADQPSLHAAAARAQRAAALAGQVQGASGPQATLGADLTEQHYTAKGLVPAPVAGHRWTSANLQVGASWSPDFFGRHAAELQAALGQQQAAALDLAAARLAVAQQVVRGYVALARLLDQRALLDAQGARRQQALALVRERAQAGLDTALDVRQAEQPVPELGQQAAALDEQIALARHQLAAWSGQAPDALAGLQPSLAALRGHAVPAHLGADLLGRRPDVQAARWRVEAAGQDVAAARAQFYPDVNLSAFVGLNALGLDRLIDWDARQYGVGPALRLPVFDGGRLQAQLQGREAERATAVAQYNAAVLDAVREAADALATLQSLDAQQQAQARTQAAAQAQLGLARQRFEAGLHGRLPVLGAEQNLLQQQRAALDLQARRLDAQAALARALGGGWGPAATAATVADAARP